MAETATYVPENINVDNPVDGDTFRVFVDYFQGNAAARPIVNVYCGGEIVATYGEADPLVGFQSSDVGGGGISWRAVDVTTRVDGSGTTTGCDVAPLHPPGQTSGPWITRGDLSY